MTDIELEKLKRYLADALPTVIDALATVATKPEQVWCLVRWLDAAILAARPEFVESSAEFIERFAAEYDNALAAFAELNPDWGQDDGGVTILVPAGPVKTEVTTTIH